MKYLLLLLPLTAATAVAQKKITVVRDSLPVKTIVKNSQTVKKATQPVLLSNQIEKELHAVLQQYTGKPNTAATWAQAKAAAENVLLPYFMSGKLQGTKAEQAFHVIMGNETMTAADINNKKMILLAGIATIKPAEFTIIRIEETCIL